MNLFLITHLFPSSDDDKATSRALSNLVKYWIHEHQVIVLRPHFVSWKKTSLRGLPRPATVDGQKVIHFDLFRIPFTRKYVLAPLKFWIRRDMPRPDAIIAHLKPNQLWAMKLLKSFPAAFVLGIHGSDVIKYNPEMVKSVKIADLVAYRSAAIMKRFEELYDTTGKTTVLIPSGIKTEEIDSEEILDAKAASWSRPKRRIIMVAAKLQKLKNIDVALRALAALQSRDWDYWIVGDGPERTQLEELTAQLDLAGNVSFLGKKERTEVLELMKKADIYLMVSAPETLGLAYLEAMAKGCLVIGSKGWGIDGIVRNGENGFLCEPRNGEELRKILEIALSDSENIIGVMVRESIRTVKGLNEERIAKEYLDAVREAIERVRIKNITKRSREMQ